METNRGEIRSVEKELLAVQKEKCSGHAKEWKYQWNIFDFRSVEGVVGRAIMCLKFFLNIYIYYNNNHFFTHPAP